MCLKLVFVAVGSSGWMCCSDVVVEGCEEIAEECRDGGINIKCKSQVSLGDKGTMEQRNKALNPAEQRSKQVYGQ